MIDLMTIQETEELALPLDKKYASYVLAAALKVNASSSRNR
jgi:hypothetical protein